MIDRRRFQHHQPQTLSHTPTSTPHSRPPSPPPYHLTLESPVSNLLRPNPQPHPPLYQRHSLCLTHIPTRRHRPIPDPPRNPAPRLLRLPRAPRYLQLQCHICANCRNERLRRRHGYVRRMSTLCPRATSPHGFVIQAWRQNTRALHHGLLHRKPSLPHPLRRPLPYLTSHTNNSLHFPPPRPRTKNLGTTKPAIVEWDRCPTLHHIWNYKRLPISRA